MIKNKWLRIFVYSTPFLLFGLLLTLASVAPSVSPPEAVVTERLYQFAKSKNVSIAAAELADGNWDKICIIDGLSGFDPIHFLHPPPKNIWWNKHVYWGSTGWYSKQWGWVLISPSGEMLVVKVDAYALDGFSLDFGSRIGCYEFGSTTISKVIKKGGTIILHFDSDLSP